jgi:hypothetical protein
MRIQVKEVAYHRNGVAGEGFHVVRFSFTEGGMPHPNLVGAVVGGKPHPNMVGIVFDGGGRVAVLDADLTAAGNIAFAMGNSWRGDQFEADLRDAIRVQEEALREADNARVALAGAIEIHDKALDKVAKV